MSILMKQMSDEPRPPSQVNPALPAGVDDVDRVADEEGSGAAAAEPRHRGEGARGGVRGRRHLGAAPDGGLGCHDAGARRARAPADASAAAMRAPRRRFPRSARSTPHALAETVPSGAQSVIGPARAKQPLPWILGGCRRGDRRRHRVLRAARRPSRCAAAGGSARRRAVQPAVEHPVVAPPPDHPAAVPVDASPAPAAALTPDAATVAPAKKPKHGGTAKPVGSTIRTASKIRSISYERSCDMLRGLLLVLLVSCPNEVTVAPNTCGNVERGREHRRSVVPHRVERRRPVSPRRPATSSRRARSSVSTGSRRWSGGAGSAPSIAPCTR